MHALTEKLSHKIDHTVWQESLVLKGVAVARPSDPTWAGPGLSLGDLTVSTEFSSLIYSPKSDMKGLASSMTD